MLELTGGGRQRAAPRHTQNFVFAERLAQRSGRYRADLMPYGLVVAVGADDLAVREAEFLLQTKAELHVGQSPVVDVDRDQAFLARSSEQSGDLETRDSQRFGDVDPGAVLKIVRPCDRRHERPFVGPVG